MSVAVKKIPGVAEADVSLNRGMASIRFEPDNRVTIEQIRRLIRSNGFTPKDAEVIVAGRLIERGGRPLLSLPGRDRHFLLVDSRGAPAAGIARRSEALDRPVVVDGRIPEHAPGGDSPLILEVRRITPEGG